MLIFFGFKTAVGELVGTMKITRKLADMEFPIVSTFGIDLNQVISQKGLSAQNIWHLGRFAINRKKLKEQGVNLSSKEILRLLLINAFSKMDREGKDLLVAESDILIYQLFHELGVNMQMVGEGQDYIGSPTYPVIIAGSDIREWLEANCQYRDNVSEMIPSK